jgi:flavin-dependent dehydrogenase
MLHDAAVIGAGPAGSAAARLLAEAAWSVALVEKAEFPRRKVCGEFISATTMPVLEACGVAARFMAAAGPPVNRVGVYAGDAMLCARPEQVLGRALGREHLDVMLRDAAVAAGARLIQPAEVMAVRRHDGGFICELDDRREVAARFLVVACGSWNSKGVYALPSSQPRPSDLFAFKAHFTKSRLPPGLMPLLAFPGGYGGMVQTDGGRMSLSCCIRRDALLRVRRRHGGRAADAVLAHILETTRGARLALDDAGLEGHFLSTGPIHPGMRARHDDGIFFTGNIAGEAHPVIAEGISMAIQASALLAELLIAHRGERYARAWKRRFALRIQTSAVFAQLAMRAPTRAASLALLRTAPGLMGLGARLAGKIPAST